MLSKLLDGVQRLASSLRLGASLGVYWFSTLCGGRTRVRWLHWACAFDERNTLALQDLLKYCPTALGGNARIRMLHWAYSIVESDLRQEILASHPSPTGSDHNEDPRVDAFYAFVAARTDVVRHPQAHLAQRFAIHSCGRTYSQSTSQLAQDRFVLFALGERRGTGYFVEFGATDGRELSNTYLLEQAFGWNGIVAEPNPAYHRALRRNRRCGISEHCVWKRSGETVRFQVVESQLSLSTMAEFEESDQHDRSGAKTLEVPTITLNDLLRKHNAPHCIDYISIDTEGSELAILEAFDFTAYDVSVFTIEHNFTPAREKIQRLMERHGYVRVCEVLSQWDDWYVRGEIAARLGIPESAESRLRIAV